MGQVAQYCQHRVPLRHEWTRVRCPRCGLSRTRRPLSPRRQAARRQHEPKPKLDAARLRQLLEDLRPYCRVVPPPTMPERLRELPEQRRKLLWSEADTAELRQQRSAIEKEMRDLLFWRKFAGREARRAVASVFRAAPRVALLTDAPRSYDHRETVEDPTFVSPDGRLRRVLVPVHKWHEQYTAYSSVYGMIYRVASEESPPEGAAQEGPNHEGGDA